MGGSRTPDPSDARALQVLVVGGDPKELGRITAFLKEAPDIRFAVEECPSLDAAIEGLGRRTVDALLLDLTPASGGLESVDRLQRQIPRIPILILAEDRDEPSADQILRRGAQDFLLKSQIDGRMLSRAIRYAVGRKHTENALRESEERFELVARAIGNAVWELDLTSRRLRWNVGAHSFLGYPPETVISDYDHWRERLHPEDRERVLHSINDVISGGGRFWMHEYRLLCADGSYAHVFDRGEVIRDDQDKPRRMVGAMTDITERKRADDSLRETNETLRTLIQASPAGILVIDRREQVRIWNRAAEQIFGWNAFEVIGHPIPMLAAAEGVDEWSPLARRVLAGEALSGWEISVKRRGGTPMEVSVSMAPLRNGRDQISGAMAVIQDISQVKAAEKHRMQLEERLWQSQKMEAVGRLAGGVAHDFNNLLTAVSGYAELIQSRFEAPDPVRTYADEILTSSDRAAQLTRQLLAFGRRQILQPRVLDLNDVVRGMEALLRRLVGEHIDLGTALDPRLGSVRADQGQIEQVIMNLAVNARDVMPNGGKLTIETRNIELEESYFERHGRARSGPHVVLVVSDTGCGMNPETRSHVFEPFFTTKEQDKGTGLGLATVYGVVKQSEGDIWVYSELGQGASFKIYLPRIDQAPAPPKEGSRIQRRAATETILLAEDSDAVRRLLREILRKAGYTVLEARNGAEALETSRTFEGVIDLLLTDMVMPQMSGRELGAHLATKRPRMRVLFMSGYTEEAIVRNGVLAPGTAFLEKPFTPTSVITRVRELLDEQGAPS